MLENSALGSSDGAKNLHKKFESTRKKLKHLDTKKFDLDVFVETYKLIKSISADLTEYSDLLDCIYE